MAQTVAAAAPYDPEWFEEQSKGSLASARRVVPIVVEQLRPASVVDIGCGVGTWLGVFREHGVTRTLGLDGDYVERRALRIDADDFNATDLSLPFSVPGRFDLAVCLEVAEHLPAARAAALVRTLVGAAPFVLFSAAIPGQGGTHHINEQWQDYWRHLFESEGYRAVDLIRPQIWGFPDVEPWYQQNSILFCAPDQLPSRPNLSPVEGGLSLNLVHPEFYLNAREDALPNLARSLRLLPRVVTKALARRLGRVDAA
ncbi:MAG: methyltransferase domain-containing protein [Gemmatimonadaceae bacterium]|nr:methyltransferase domain-containing protein [Acetobacteraceae bacterium]